MNFVGFSDTQIVGTDPAKEFKGNQNDGMNFVMFRDGSGGITKKMKDWTGNKTGRLYTAAALAANEYLAARVGQAIDAPIRDCGFIGNGSSEIVMPYISGSSGKELGSEDYYPDTDQGIMLRLFDYLTANSDRRPKNLMYSGNGNDIVGIDHALCNFRRKPINNHVVAELWNGGITANTLKNFRAPLSYLESTFAELGAQEQYGNLMANLEAMIWAFDCIEKLDVVEKGGPGSGAQAGHPFMGNQWSGTTRSAHELADRASQLDKLGDATNPSEHASLAEAHQAMADIYQERLGVVSHKADIYNGKRGFAEKATQLQAQKQALSRAVNNNLVAAQAHTDAENGDPQSHYTMTTGAGWGGSNMDTVYSPAAASANAASAAEQVDLANARVSGPMVGAGIGKAVTAVLKSVWNVLKGGPGSGDIPGHPFQG